MAESVPPAHAAARGPARGADVLYALTLLLAATLPFELIHPVVVLPWLVFTNVEIVVIAGALVWAVVVAASVTGMARRWRSTAAAHADLLLPLVLFLLLALLSALLAPSHQREALKLIGRLMTGVLAGGLAASVATTRKRLSGLLWAITLGAAASASLGLLEAWNWRELGVLTLFKNTPTLVGGELRVSATFQYATIASMFFEMAVPLALALAATATHRAARILATLAACLGAVVVVLTLTRTGLVTVAIVVILCLTLAWRRPSCRRLAAPGLSALLALSMALAGLALTSPAFRTRMVTENDAGWYDAAYAAPTAFSVKTGDPMAIIIGLHNTGQATWLAQGDHAFALGCRWLARQDWQELQAGRIETELPEDVSPGASVNLTVQAPVTLPAGAYRLSCGMLQRGILWFRHRNVPEADILVEVLPGLALYSPPEPARGDDASATPPTLARRTLWRAAWLMLRERPLLGVGPGNFRHVHGLYLDIPVWDSDIHANSLYLELLADLGLPGLVFFVWLLLAVAGRWRAALCCGAPDPLSLWSLGLGGSLLAFLLHGLLDYYLEFTGPAILFWMLLGLMVAATCLAQEHPVWQQKGGR